MNCNDCKNYSPLVEPRKFKEVYTIYGYCFKDPGFNDKGYPVYITEGSCKYFIHYTKKSSGSEEYGKLVQKTQRSRGNKSDCENQMRLEDFTEVMP